MEKSDYIIIVAGGKGLRMGTDIPKQFLPVGGKPVLMRTIERFQAYSESEMAAGRQGLSIILVLPKAQQAYWHELCEQYAFTVEHTIADGGETVFGSFPTMLKAWLAYTTACDRLSLLRSSDVVSKLPDRRVPPFR